MEQRQERVVFVALTDGEIADVADHRNTGFPGAPSLLLWSSWIVALLVPFAKMSLAMEQQAGIRLLMDFLLCEETDPVVIFFRARFPFLSIQDLMTVPPLELQALEFPISPTYLSCLKSLILSLQHFRAHRNFTGARLDLYWSCVSPEDFDNFRFDQYTQIQFPYAAWIWY